jgi:catechol 2,3-dioxygenase-like lactoylglutathione lyase family enzyme
MPPITPRIDHVVINVANQLDEAVAQYRRLGFTLTPRGHHSLGSSNHLAIFDDDYLELLGYEPRNAQGAARQWGTTPGLTGLVFKTTDADSLFAELSARGIRLDGAAPQAFFRPIELPDGSTREVRFRTVRLDPAAIPNGRIFFCHHLDPDLVWRREWQDHPNGASAIRQTIVEARDPAASIKLLERTFGSADVVAIDGGQRLTAGNASIDFLTPPAVRTRFGDATESSQNGHDRKVALVLQTHSLDQARQALQDGGIAFREKNGEIVVPAGDAFGVALAFVE